METHYSTAADPPEIRNKIASLQSQKAIIEDLTLRLQHAQTEYKRLDTKIKAYRASVSPIQTCPEEVLLMIFHAYTRGNPELATHLLSVCHRWYDIATNAPGLWNVINIQFKETWDVKSEAVIASKKFRTCLKYSACLPLHITFNCQALEPASSRLNDYLAHCLQKIDPDQDDISGALWEYNFDLTPFTTEASRCHPDHVIEFIPELIGTNGVQMKRCESLEILFPEDRTLRAQIWRHFDWNAPNLAKLSIRGMFPVPSGCSLTTGYCESDLSSLEALELLGGITHLDFLPLKFDPIKCLTLETDFEGLHQSLQLSRFTRLERLVLYCDPSFKLTLSATIALPCLKSLFVSNYTGPWNSWNVPVLQLLEVTGYVGMTPDWLPNVQTSHVLLGHSVSFSVDVDLRSYLHQILSKYTVMKQLTIPARFRQFWEGLLQQLTQQQELPPELPVVSFSPDEGEDDYDD